MPRACPRACPSAGADWLPTRFPNLRAINPRLQLSMELELLPDGQETARRRINKPRAYVQIGKHQVILDKNKKKNILPDVLSRPCQKSWARKPPRNHRPGSIEMNRTATTPPPRPQRCHWEMQHGMRSTPRIWMPNCPPTKMCPTSRRRRERATPRRQNHRRKKVPCTMKKNNRELPPRSPVAKKSPTDTSTTHHSPTHPPPVTRRRSRRKIRSTATTSTS